MKLGNAKNNSLLTKYSLQYEKKPRSRVFAPLAESYRKIGMLEEALKVLRKGIKIHPNYTLGHIVLANCYYDKNQFEAAYSTLLPLVSNNLENIRLQKLFAQVCEKLSNFDEALNAYKVLLLINPKDKHIAKKVKELEDNIEIPKELVDEDKEFDSSDLFDTDEDDWVQVDFNKSEVTVEIEESYDQWNVVVPQNEDTLENYKRDIKENKLEVNEHELDDGFFYEVYDNHSEDTIDPVTDKMTDEYDDRPIITHTLVDLYCEQGHFDKAISILESILELHPTDKASIRKLEQIHDIKSGKAVAIDKSFYNLENNETSDSIKAQMIDNVDHHGENQIKVHNSKNFKQEQVEKKLRLFLQQIQETANLKRNETAQNSNY